MQHDVNAAMADPSAIYRGLAGAVAADDLGFANYESPVDDGLPRTGYPRFNSSSGYLAAAIDAGFDVLSFANNHAADYGEPGIRNTLREIEGLSRTRDFAWSGLSRAPANPRAPASPRGAPGRGAAERFPLALRSAKGLRVGFLAVTSLLNRPGEDGGLVDLVCLRDAGGPDERALERFLARVAAARAACDFLVVGLHDGIEYSPDPSPLQRRVYRRVADAGADVVWGSHPHVPSGWELVDAERGGGKSKALVIYSMGNLVSAYLWRIDPSAPGERADTADALVARVELEAIGSSASIARVEPRFFACYQDPKEGMVLRRCEDLAADAGLSAPWRRFYADRLARMKSIAPRWEAQR